MADFPSTNVRINSQLSPFTVNQDFPLFDTKHGLGGFITVQNATERDAIFPRRRVEGMVVYVKGETKFYALIGTTANSGWTTGFTFGSGGGGIVGDYVSTFNGLSGAVQGVSAALPGDGISVSGATGAVTITNTGVTRAVPGTGISVSGATGSVTITNIGAVSVNGYTGAITNVAFTNESNTFTQTQTISSTGGLVVQSSNTESTITVSPERIAFSPIADSGTQFLYGDTTSGNKNVYLPAGSGTLALTSQLMGTVNGSTAATTAVTSFNGLTGAVGGVCAAQANTFTALQTFSSGISAAGGITFNGSVSTNSLAITNNATVGGTLSVEGNFYVAGTLTTLYESQLLIEDKYLVLGSTFAQTSDGASGGVYLGSTGSSAIASFIYNDTLKSWDSNRSINIAGGTAYYIGGAEVLSGQTLGTGVLYSSLTKVGTLVVGTWNASVIGLTYGGTNKNLSSAGVSGGIVFKTSNSLDVLASAGNNGEYLRSNGANAAPSWASFSTLTGITATSVNITDTSDSGTYRITMIDSSGFGAKLVYADAGITFNAVTNTLSCEKIEAMVDGGTW